MITHRAVATYAVLPLLALSACRSPRPGFEQDVAVRQFLPPPADTSWKDQAPVETAVNVGPDSLPVVITWTPAHRGPHRAISRINVVFPEHPASDSLCATIFGSPINHGTRDAVLQGLTLHVTHHRDGGATPTVVYLTGDGRRRL